MATVVDFCCNGPGLLSAVPEKHTRIAVIDDGDLRTKIIISKKLPDVKIIERKDAVNILKTMKNLNIIMNPPYDGSLHLKILNSVTKTFPEAKIVNLSPVDWLQNVYGGSAYNKFKDLKFDCEYVGLLKNLFDSVNKASYHLGIYYITKNTKNTAQDYLTKLVTFDNKHFIDENLVSSIKEKLVKYNDGLESHIKSGEITDKSKYTIVIPKFVGGSGLKNDRFYWKNGRWNKIFYKGICNGVTPSENKMHFSNVQNYTDFDYLEFDTEQEAKNWAATNDLIFMRFCTLLECVDSHRRCKYVPYMNDYTHEWTDEMLYKFFDLTEEEIKIIESEIK